MKKKTYCSCRFISKEELNKTTDIETGQLTYPKGFMGKTWTNLFGEIHRFNNKSCKVMVSSGLYGTKFTQIPGRKK